jgi:hypothetical protein
LKYKPISYILISFGIILCIAILLISIYFTPDFIANNLSPDNYLEDVTIKQINFFRLISFVIGFLFIAILLLFLFRPNLMSLMNLRHDEVTYKSFIENRKANKKARINPYCKFIIIFTPIVIMLVYSYILYNPLTRNIGLLLLEENNLIEILTFIFFTIGGILGFRLSIITKKSGENFLTYGFYFIYSIGLIIIAMEEIAWGQWFFGFDTPEALIAINRQGETTLHNIGCLQGHSEILRLSFGIGGLVGICLNFHPFFRNIGAPLILLSWFTIISFHAFIDVVNDIIPINRQFDYFMQRTSELIELYISISALLYIQLNRSNYTLNFLDSRKDFT